MSSIEDDDIGSASAVEMHVLTVKECFIYKVPPLKSASGHRAEEWGLETPLFTGCLQIFQADKKLRIALYTYKDQTRLIMEADNLTPFGQCPIEIKPGEGIMNFVDGVIDSSRYYVVRLKDPKSSRWAWIGVGFRDREIAFDFKTALNEYMKYIDRSELASKLSAIDHFDTNSTATAGDTEDDDESRARKSDHRTKQQESLLHLEQHIEPLKEGEKIKVNFKSASKQSTQRAAGGATFSGLKPPPLPGATVFGTILPPSTATAAASTADSTDLFSDFTSSTPASTVATNTTSATAENDDDWSDFVST